VNECPFCYSPLDDTYQGLQHFKCGSWKPTAKNTKATQSERCLKKERDALLLMVSTQSRRIQELEGELKAATERPGCGGVR
jgi:hypothetical protein